MPLSASSQTRLQMAPPTQPNMKSSCFKMNQKSQDATDHETMNLWAPKGLFTNQRVTSLRLHPSLYTVISFGWFTSCTLKQIASFVAGGWKQKGWKGEQYVIFQCNFIHSLLYTCRPCYAWQKWRLQRWWKHLQKWLFNCCSLTAGVFRHEGNSLPLYQQ